jgi:poly-gamma-glutamate synthesis protein (capsule biosynthesis protein)
MVTRHTRYPVNLFLLLTGCFVLSCADTLVREKGIGRSHPLKTNITNTSLSTDNFQNKARIMCTGDIMTHLPLVKAYKINNGKSYDFSQLFENVSPLLKEADIAIGNLETVLAGDSLGITGYPDFNGPQVLAKNLKDAGFTVLTTSNNHSFDRGLRGVRQTIQNLDAVGILHVGTAKDTTDSLRYLIMNKNGIKLGILSYTYGINGELSRKNSRYINTIDTAVMLKHIASVKKCSVDVIIASIHFGIEYQTRPSTEQQYIIHFLWRNGVSIVFGHHTHTLQSAVFDSSGNNFAIFSMGNFISNQKGNGREFGVIVDITIEKTDSLNKIKIYTPRFHPTCVLHRYGNFSQKYKIVLLDSYTKDSTESIKYHLNKKQLADTLPLILQHLQSYNGNFTYDPR